MASENPVKETGCIEGSYISRARGLMYTASQFTQEQADKGLKEAQIYALEAGQIAMTKAAEGIKNAGKFTLTTIYNHPS